MGNSGNYVAFCKYTGNFIKTMDVMMLTLGPRKRRNIVVVQFSVPPVGSW